MYIALFVMNNIKTFDEYCFSMSKSEVGAKIIMETCLTFIQYTNKVYGFSNFVFI